MHGRRRSCEGYQDRDFVELSKVDTASVKGVAILIMLWHHLFLNAPEFGTFTDSLAVVSKVCVALFLFVSGYGLTKQYGSLKRRNVESTAKFLGRRFVNFFSQYWFCFILVILVGNLCGYTFHEAYPATRNVFKCIILDAFGQMGYDSYLKSWWFNKMILQPWVVFPLLYLIVSNKYSALVGLIAIAFMQLYVRHLPGNVFFLVEGGVPAFYLGMCSASHRIASGKNQRVWTLSVSFLMIPGLSVLLLKVVKDPYQAILVRALLALCIVYALKAFRQYGSFLADYIGKYATIMYLTHVLLLVLIPGINSFLKYSFPVFLVFTVACLAIAIVIDHLEKVSRLDEMRKALTARIDRL